MRTFTLCIAFLSFITFFGPIQAQEANSTHEYVLLVVSSREDSRRAQEQIDEISAEPKFMRLNNIQAYQVLPNSIRSLTSDEGEISNNFRKFQRFLEDGNAFRVILLNKQGTTVFQGEETLSLRDLDNLINENRRRRNPREIDLDTNQSK